MTKKKKTKSLAMKEKIKRLATKAELKARQNKTVKLQRYDLIFFYW